MVRRMPTFVQRHLYRIINFYPPYLGAGIRFLRRESAAHTLKVELNLRSWNRNLFGTQFGGSLYSMCDPWFVFLLVRHLGPDYVVWDKAATVEFLRPGRGRVTASFHVPPETVEMIRAAADRDGRTEPILTVDVVADDGEVVARVTKTLWVRRKGVARPEGGGEPNATQCEGSGGA